MLEDDGYLPAFEEEPEAFLVFGKKGHKSIPVNPEWEAIWDGDPIFRCLCRDLGRSRRNLLISLNQVRL